MTNDEISARLHVLETATMLALGIYLANSRNDPTYEKAEALVQAFVSAARDNTRAEPATVQATAARYSDHLASILRENIRALRGEGGRTN